MSLRSITSLLLRRGGSSAVLVFALAHACLAQSPTGGPQGDLTQVSIENLMNMEVTSVSKREQKLSRTAAAIFVITQEDILRSGAMTIPDLLRMVPGMDVAQIDGNSWAVTARGFNSRFSNELEVMLDGRIVYTPTFGGVFWDVFDLPFEDIERIEVIRGPGGTLWDANAVNGVINVITKTTKQTEGTMIIAGGGNQEQEFGTAQYGGSFGKNTEYRVHTKFSNWNHLLDSTGANGGDGWHLLQSGFRIDSAVRDKNQFTEAGGIYTGREAQLVTFLPSVTVVAPVTMLTEINLSGGFLQSVWEHKYSGKSETNLQVSFDRYTRNDVLGETRNTLNADFQHHLMWGTRQEVVWGVGYRFSDSTTVPNFSVSLHPADSSTELFSGFIQDEVRLLSSVYLTLGTKLEHNDYTGLGVFPGVRVTWSPTEREMFWGAVSRAGRIPASTDTGLRVNFAAFPGPRGLPTVLSAIGNPRYQDEGLTAYEAGYRSALGKRASLDVALYYNDYDTQGTSEPGTAFLEGIPGPAHLVIPLMGQNLMHGETHGIEVAASLKVNNRWTIAPGYAFEQIHMHTEAASRDTTSAEEAEGSSPIHSAEIRSHLGLPRAVAWNASVYFVDRLHDLHIPAYTRLDTGLDWTWKENVVLSVVGQNLTRDHHEEFIDTKGSVNSSLMKRSVYVKLTYRF